MNAWDKVIAWFAPQAGVRRAAARAALRHYEGASQGARTSRWDRDRGDANRVTRLAIAELRMHARDLLRNNGWPKNAQRVIANNTVGWGIIPKALGPEAAAAQQIWKTWAESTECETEDRHTFYGIQKLTMRSVFSDGEFLIRRRPRLPQDELSVPMQLQVLEADFLDTAKDAILGSRGGPIIQGVEFDAIGRRVAYWLFPQHPGSSLPNGVLSATVGPSKPVPAEDIIHVYSPERPGQVRGVSMLAQSIVNLKDLDEYEDAELVKQKIAACFAAFVVDVNGTGQPLGDEDTSDSSIDKLQPAMIQNLPPGRDIRFGNPPNVTEGNFTTRNLRKIAAGLGVTYEDLTGDYSNVNFSSARMARLQHWANVYDWQWHLLVPSLCQGVWYWLMEMAQFNGLLKTIPEADWTCPPMPMIEPDKEGLALQRLVRNGAMTPSEMVREQGRDPDTHWAEYAADMKQLKALGIILDSDASETTAAGMAQMDPAAAGAAAPQPAKRELESETIEGEVVEDAEWIEVPDL